MLTAEERETNAWDAIHKAQHALEEALSALHEAVGVVSDDDPGLVPSMLRYRSYARRVEAVLQEISDAEIEGI